MSYPLDICLISGGMSHDGLALQRGSLGGSETAAIRIAEALAARGHAITVFAPCQPMLHNGVTWLPIDQFPGYAQTVPHDVTIVSRVPEYLRFALASKLRVLWCHDLALKRSRGSLYGSLWGLDMLFVLSPYMRRQYEQVYEGVPKEIYVLTRNGIDLKSFQGLRFLGRDRCKLVYGSRPERGLEQCLNVMDELRRRNSPYRLEVSTYDNNPPQLAPLYDAWLNRARSMPNVVVKGPLKQDEWYRQLASAGALIYPTDPSLFREISCLVSMEAMACGTPIVAGKKGALPDTIGDGPAIFLGDETTNPNDESYIRQFADALEQLRTDDVLWRRLSKAGQERAAGLGWDGIAEQWETEFLTRIEAQSEDAFRVRRHLERIGEREVAA